MKKKRQAREATRMEQKASRASAGELKDSLQQYVNSIGQATRIFEEGGDPVALDVIIENLVTVRVLAVELRSRKSEGYQPAPDAHLEKLTQEFLRRQAERAGAPE